MIKTKLYRFFALVFAVTGLAIFAILYFKHIDGNLLGALQKPLLIFTILLPFCPAAILAWKAERAERALSGLLQGPPAAHEKEKASATGGKK